MQKDLKLFFILFLSLNLISCSNLSKLKFWGDDEEEIEVPDLWQIFAQNSFFFHQIYSWCLKCK